MLEIWLHASISAPSSVCTLFTLAPSVGEVICKFSVYIVDGSSCHVGDLGMHDEWLVSLSHVVLNITLIQ